MSTEPAPPTEAGGEGCTVCDGPLVELGGLGRLVWSRCRDCGLEQNRPADPDPGARAGWFARLLDGYDAAAPSAEPYYPPEPEHWN
jgi:hypothetical protein